MCCALGIKAKIYHDVQRAPLIKQLLRYGEVQSEQVVWKSWRNSKRNTKECKSDHRDIYRVCFPLYIFIVTAKDHTDGLVRTYQETDMPCIFDTISPPLYYII